MKAKILVLQNEGSKNTCYLVNLSTADDYNIVAEILKNQSHAEFIEKPGAIWAYGEKCEYQGKFFILGIEDDIDCYFAITDKNSHDEAET